jgi:hypothetical protein
MSAETNYNAAVHHTVLPGPNRKRLHTSYAYRLTYRNPEQTAAGSVMLWEVSGGRMPYQVALERDETGNLQLHCTCADAVFRAEEEGRFCKHIHGLMEIGREEGSNLESIPLGA